MMPKKKLTIGSLVYDDYEGIFFSYQSLRLNNQDILDDLDLLVVDNNPQSPEGRATKNFCGKTQIRYKTFEEYKSTALRNKVFEKSEATHTLCIDPHVLFEPTTIKNLIAFYEKNPKCEDLFHGPMLMDGLRNSTPMTHMDPVWRAHMWGVWGADPKGREAKNEPFEIPMHGLGLFSCKTDAWLGFNEEFIGFGGEEGYIHEKFRQHQKRIWCLPFLRWLHRFERPRGVPYPLQAEQRIHNYFVGFNELGLELKDMLEHFKKEAPAVDLEYIRRNLKALRHQLIKGKMSLPDLQLDPPTAEGASLELPRGVQAL